METKKPGYLNNIYSIETCWDFITIKINDLIHLQFPNVKDMICVHTWIDRTGATTKWIIQFTNFKTGATIQTCEYDRAEKWQEILKLWESKFKSKV